MSVLYATGWEAGSMEWYRTSAVPWVGGSLDTSAAYQHRSAGGYGGNYAMLPGFGVRTQPKISTSARWVHFWATPAVAPGTINNLSVVVAYEFGAQITVLFTFNGSILIYRGDTLITTEAAAYNPFLAHWFAIKFVAQDAPNGVCDVYVDDALVASVPAGTDMQQQTSPDWNLLCFGNEFGNLTNTPAARNFRWAIDDIIVTDDATGHLVEHYIPSIGPTSDASPLTLTPSTGVTHYTLIDEVPVSTTDYNAATAAGQEDFYGLSDLAANAATILCVQPLAYAYREGSITLGELAVESGGTTSYGTSTVLPSTYFSQCLIVELDPATGLTWTPAGVNAMTAGYRFT